MPRAKTPRRPLDFYPTPASATHALLSLLEGLWDGATAFDPAAGEGDLLGALGATQTAGIELDPERAQRAGVPCGDGLALDYPDMDLITNPPFGLLDAFWLRVQTHRLRNRRLCAVLTPVAWWSAEKRRAYEKPDLIGQLGWRPTFHPKIGDGGHKGSQDFCWSVLLPEPTAVTQWVRLEKPRAARG